MLREIIEKIEDNKPKDENNSDIGKDEKGINGKKPILQKD